MNIFISRHLKANSPLSSITADHHVVAIPLIYFDAIPFDPPESDWIFFYSKNGVKYFFEHPGASLMLYKWACMSKGTANELSNHIMDISFVGSGRPMSVADQFSELVTDHEKVCFIRAKNSVDSVLNLMGDKRHFSLPVYDNKPETDIPTDEFHILIFTSPLNVKTYFKHRPYEGQKIIVIGETTAKAVYAFGFDVEVHVAESPSEKSMADKLSLLLNL